MVHVLGRRKIKPGRIGLRSLGDGIECFECLLRFRGTEDADFLYAREPTRGRRLVRKAADRRSNGKER